jgi:hypothetical protein
VERKNEIWGEGEKTLSPLEKGGNGRKTPGQKEKSLPRRQELRVKTKREEKQREGSRRVW